MIFLTVGTQLPFDRLVLPVYNWCIKKEIDFILQTGKSSLNLQSEYIYENLSPDEYAIAFNKCSLVIAHAGMGTILSCAKANKPLLILPRKFSLGEHRNDHQIATVKGLRSSLKNILCETESELIERLNTGDFCSPSLQNSKLEQLRSNLGNLLND